MDSNFDLNLPYIANENEFFYLNQTPTDEEVDTLDNEEVDDALVNSHVYASEMMLIIVRVEKVFSC